MTFLPHAISVSALLATTFALAQIPPKAVANAAIELSGAIGGRIINCPKNLSISPEAVCLLATGTVTDAKPKIKAKLGNRVVEDWQSRAGSTSANLLFRTGDAITYVLMAPASKDTVFAVIDAPTKGGADTPSGTTTAGSSTTTPARTATAAKPPAVPVSYANVQNLRSVLTITPSGNSVTLARPGQTFIMTVGSASARLNGGNVNLPGAPFAQGANVFVPVTALRSLQCTVTSTGKNEVTVTCGDKTAKVATVSR